MRILLQQTSPQKFFWMESICSPAKRLLVILTLLFFGGTQIFAQSQILVKGKILNEKNQPVVGASVVVKGTASGVTSNELGEFQINAPSDGTLVFSSVGYPAREISVSGKATHNITLSTSAMDLDQVIVVGYGTQKKRDVTGSIVSVKGETLSEIKAPNILSQLQGRAAGVDIVNNSTNIGDGGEIRIRGNRSLTGNNNPLIVVDGMAYGGSLNDISSENIASLDVLKDASATAIYGSRGSNGVIIITTKRGTSQKSVTSYNGYVGVVNAMDTWRTFNGTEYAQFKEDARQGQPGYLTNPNITSPYHLTAIEQTNLKDGVNTNWQDLLLTTGVRTGHDLNVRGGNDRTQYFFGLGYYKETGIITDQVLDRYTFNVNIDHKVSERIKVGFTSFNTMIRSDRLGTNAYGQPPGCLHYINLTTMTEPLI